MVAAGLEIGQVKFFNNRKQFGFLCVLDKEGSPTGEEIYFHLNHGVYPTMGKHLYVDFSDLLERGCQRLRFPRRGDKLVFDTLADDSRKLVSWTYFELWEEEERKPASTPFKWRLTRSIWQSYLYQEEPGGLTFGDNEELIQLDILRHGTALLKDIKSWDGQHFGLYKSEEEGGFPAYAVEVQLENGSWANVRRVTLVDEPDEE